MKAKQFLDIDFGAACAAGTYAALVAGIEPLAYLGDLIATPQVAISFAAVALSRFALKIRTAVAKGE